MQIFYHFTSNWQKGVYEIAPRNNILFDGTDSANSAYSQLNGIEFYIKKRGKKADVIRMYGSVQKFFSIKIKRILEKYMDMDKYMSPINILGVNEQFFFIHDLPEYEFINRDICNNNNSQPSFILTRNMPKIFTLNDTFLNICSLDIKLEMERQKVTNIVFREVYGYTQEEWDNINSFPILSEL